MTNKTKAAVWTLIMLIALSLLSVFIVLVPKGFLLLLVVSGFSAIIYVVYKLILNDLNSDE